VWGHREIEPRPCPVRPDYKTHNLTNHASSSFVPMKYCLYLQFCLLYKLHCLLQFTQASIKFAFQCCFSWPLVLSLYIIFRAISTRQLTRTSSSRGWALLGFRTRSSCLKVRHRASTITCCRYRHFYIVLKRDILIVCAFWLDVSDFSTLSC
jgi:hypothetical protein